jgi:hypothetical protein
MARGQHRNTWIVRFPEDLLPVVQRIALAEDRKESDVARLLIREACRHRGLVPDTRQINNIKDE